MVGVVDAPRVSITASQRLQVRLKSRCPIQPLPGLGATALPSSAVELVGIILFLRDVGFSLRELKALIASRPALDGWRQLAQRKLTELDQRIAQAQAARTAISHALACPHEDILQCPNFASVITAHRNPARYATQASSSGNQRLVPLRTYRIYAIDLA